jgi:hypothetical protein
MRRLARLAVLGLLAMSILACDDVCSGAAQGCATAPAAGSG